MDKRTLKRKLLLGLGWSASIAVGAGALAALLNVVISYTQGYLGNGGPLILGGTLLIILSTALFVFPLALLFFWIQDFITYYKKKRINSKDKD